MLLHPAERTILMVIAALAGVDAALIWHKNIDIHFNFFAFPAAVALLMLGIGQFYRRFRPSERLALTANMVAFYAAYSSVAALFNVVLLPRPSAPIDPLLVQIDAWFGYSWPAFCAWFAEHPALSGVVRWVYTFTLEQLLFAFMFLGLIADRQRLHQGLLALVMASLITIFTWAIFPSTGPGGVWTLAPEVDAAVRPLGSSVLGAELNRLLVEGVRDVSTLSTTGLIGFPSFHTAMGLISLLAVWAYVVPRLIALVLTALLLPGILAHGGHHLMDVVAGMAVTGLSWWLAGRAFEAQERRRGPFPFAASPMPAA